ncbi:NAD(P)H-hydrate dehydratase [Halapricum hydrolyticum]|uniref:Bifunctional NAD(P)H-hydrate repair enzyme n=1 Tax=Halapricum hydrolyticum TaxID=2979991 RepID=A0AAE3IAW4_9EURY|nr:NAD(P)H-hydrate dehydratase [Halapricum hydrolyticum]MCU4718015.1 NAD(P)H-hydrate dehydratase [Halapricum hydrolyticum]MCU4727180.1 NAD(P)H-hydrate dehydratase [Halapricum hydrolyticum]
MSLGEAITGTQMAVIDGNSAALGVPPKQLMESAGNAVARAVRSVVEPGGDVTIVAGRGNNGGDAFAAARFLDEYDVRVRLLGHAKTITTDIARENWAALQRSELDAAEWRDSSAIEFDDPVLFVDAMLGTGISGRVREPLATAAGRLNDSETPVLSVDVPSGLDGETGTLAENAVEADHVVTFHKPKPGLDALDASVTVADIGIPAAAERFVERGDLLRLSRPADSHKGDFGEVLVVGGGPYTGAPALAAQAALRAGADLVRVACPRSVADEIQSYSENLIVRPFDGERFTSNSVARVRELAAEHDSVVLGPGLGAAENTLVAVQEFLGNYDGFAVVDADALQVVPSVETDATLLCTPHQGELEAMGGETAADWRERADLVESFAAELGQPLLVKGPYDVLSDGERTRVNRTGNPGMTVGGTGDVLAGTVGALAATQEPLAAAAIGAYVTGKAGDRVVDRQGYGLVATDLLGAIPPVMWEDNDA